MADVKTHRSEMSKGGQLTQRDRDLQGLPRWDPWSSSPFDWMDRFSDEVDRTFGRILRDFGFPRGSTLRRGAGLGLAGRGEPWSPRVEAFQKGDQFIVRAELPGLKKDDVHVELTEDALMVHGERREEHKEAREGYYHSERQYGQFHRTIPLPAGVIAETTKASFRDGVLEITMQAAPAEANRGRKIEIVDSVEGERKK